MVKALSQSRQVRNGTRLSIAALGIAVLGAAIGFAFLAAPALAETPEEKGLDIAREIDRRDLGWTDSEVDLNMILINRNGESSTRDLRTQSLENTEAGLGDKGLTIFDRPRDIEGTAFLSHTKITEPDDQWIYLPAIKRVKRISSVNKSGPFVGSEFAYEDLSSQEVEKYKYKWLRDEGCGELQCFVIDRYPVYEHSGYTKQVVWVDQDEYRVMKVEYYDRKNELLKVLVQSEYRQYLETYWRPLRMQMDNVQTGKATTLTFTNYKFRTGVDEGSFTPSRLKRAR
ncbi:outer membrane lipoprotein-sorting protein [Rhodospirillaceae bacterium AH-315-P19]|nr:outer membrane lipoprotein-sorting protein [Rhodospirillaceae bacterium AH-315-P19]